MKKLAIIAALLACGFNATAAPAVMLGLSYNLGGATSITLKLLSTNRVEKPALAAGVSYAPRREANHWSWDTGVAYNFKSTSLVLSYDWVPAEVQVSFGLANLKQAKAAPVAQPAPAVPAPTVTLCAAVVGPSDCVPAPTVAPPESFDTAVATDGRRQRR